MSFDRETLEVVARRPRVVWSLGVVAFVVTCAGCGAGGGDSSISSSSDAGWVENIASGNTAGNRHRSKDPNSSLVDNIASGDDPTEAKSAGEGNGRGDAGSRSPSGGGDSGGGGSNRGTAEEFLGNQAERCQKLLQKQFTNWSCPSCKDCEDLQAPDVPEDSTCFGDSYIGTAATNCWAIECYFQVKSDYTAKEWADLQSKMKEDRKGIKKAYDNLLKVCSSPCGGTTSGNSFEKCVTVSVWPSECDCVGG